MATKPAAYMHFGDFDAYGRLDFDKKAIRKGMRKSGALIRQLARKLVNRKVTSRPGEYPGRVDGLLFRSIRAKVSKPGFLVKVAPQKIAGMKDFYPAYLHYGVRRGARLAAGTVDSRKSRRKRIQLRAARRNNAWQIEPRDNFMVDALESGSDRVRQMLRQAFAESLK